MTESPKDYIPKLYGRRQDKPLKPRQAVLMETLLPQVAAPEGPGCGEAVTRDFSDKKEIWFEIGFGGGEHLAWHAQRRPDTGFIGAEPFVNGVAKLLTQIEELNLKNVKILHGDARPLMEALPDASIARLFVLHPDPWPKRRHHKRRIVSPWFLQEASRLLKAGGELRIASDIPDYVLWTLTHVRHVDELVWTAERARDWKDRPADWPQTRYEAKAIREGRRPAYLTFRKA